MVMKFVLHPLSHYNSIIEPRARFLLSLLEDLSIDFPSAIIRRLMISSFSPSAIMRIIHHFSISILNSHLFMVMGAIRATSVR